MIRSASRTLFNGASTPTRLRRLRRPQEIRALGQGAAATAHEYTYTFDRQSRVAFENTKPVALAVEASVRLFKQMGQSQLLGQAVEVSERQFPRIHALAMTASDTLQIAMPQVFVVNSPASTPARYGTNEDSFMIVHSALVDQYSDEELLTVIGHECGHIHNSHVAYLTALHYLTYMAGMFLPWILQPALVALRAWSRRAEITCDRAGMLVAGDAAGVRAGHHEARRRVDASSTRSSTSTPSSSSTTRAGGASAGSWRSSRRTRGCPSACSPCGSSRKASSSAPSEPGREGVTGLSMSEVDDRVAALLKGDA